MQNMKEVKLKNTNGELNWQQLVSRGGGLAHKYIKEN
jgi:hypothetical protein